MKEYDIFVPLRYNDGSPVEPKKFRDLQVRLLEYFNGLTFFPQPNEGYWRMADVTYRDEVVVYRVIEGGTAGPPVLKTAQDRVKARVQAGGDFHRGTQC